MSHAALASVPYRTGPTEAPAPPVVRGLPYVGSALGFGGDLPALLVRLYRVHGPIFDVKVMGRSFTVLAGREANLLLTHEQELFRSREAWERFNLEMGTPHALTTMDGEPHVRMRKVMKPGFSRGAAADRLAAMVRIARDETARWPVGQPVGVNAALKPLVIEQLGLLIAGTSPREYVDDLTTFLRLNLAVNVTRALPPVFLRWPPYARARERCRELARSVLRAHRDGSAPRTESSLVYDLLDVVREEPSLLAERDLELAALGPFVAGLDTVANATTFILYRLLRHPEVMAAATAEADAMFAAGGDPDPEKLKYLRAVAMETLRLHPVAPLGIRFATREFEFAGRRVRADAPLMVATSVPHFLDEHFTRPTAFEPERFQAPRNEHRQQGAYAPFGQGAHICLGAGLAEVQMVLTVAAILHAVRFRMHPADYVLKTVMSPTLMPTRTFSMVVTERRAHA